MRGRIVAKIFRFKCLRCGTHDKHLIDVEQMNWNFTCPHCGKGIYQIIRSGSTNGTCFQPFVTEDITGEPVEVTSPGHRDRLLAENGLTLDSYSDHLLSQRRRQHLNDISSVNGLSLETVMEEAKRRGPIQ